MINKLSYRSTGLYSNYWSQCTVNNGTYLDCPIANHVNETFIVTVQNPSMQAVYYQRIKVPHRFYSVAAWSATSKSFVNVSSTVFCHNNKFENGYSIRDCDMFIENRVDFKSLSWLKVMYDPNAPINPGQMTRFSYQTENTRGSLFAVNCPEDGVERYFAFQIRYYQSDEGGDDYPDTDNVPSGAYIFKPAKNAQYSLPYVNVTTQNIEEWNSAFVQQTTLYYSDPATNRSARAIIRAFDKNPNIEVELLLDPLPASGRGQEVTANFFAYNMDNNHTFYTDSNALEMQQRILNYRPTWNLTTDQPISSNYYPINSAIVIKDTTQNLAFVVTNDRSQGGSVIENSRIEFMHNRRLFKDDDRGVGEPLSENGPFGNGIQIQATYTLQFVNMSATYSKQRFTQLTVDDPLQYSFAFNYSIDNSSVLEEQVPIAESAITYGAQPAPVKVHAFPIGRNQLMIRVENIADLFDYPANTSVSSTGVYADIPQLAKNLF